MALARRLHLVIDMPTALRQDSQAHLDTVLTLPRETDAVAIARVCRDAALEFLNESDGWGKAELATWLLGPYAQVTQYAQADSSRRPGAPALPLLREIDAATVEDVMRRARVEVREALEQLFEAEGAASFAFSMLAAGFVIRCEDTLDVVGWTPTRAPQRLADRVLSLFAADFLTRPADYERCFFLCSLCRNVEFDATSRLQGACERHGPRGSGIWGRRQPYHSHPPSVCTSEVRYTLPYIPDVA